MKLLNFGSMNYDFVYGVPYIVKSGETLSSSSMHRFFGGKGFNQSIALSRAGMPVYHAGTIGSDGVALLNALRENKVDTKYISRTNTPSGHAIIQLGMDGQNSIILHGGANFANTTKQVDDVMDEFESGDVLLLQNEVNHVNYIIDKAYKKGLRIFLNPSPYSNKLINSLEKVDFLLINEIEGLQITSEKTPEYILAELSRRYPKMEVIITLGHHGAVYRGKKGIFRQDAYSVPVVDTTAAGDTFTGYFISAILRSRSIPEALQLASKAAALAVSANGAYPSIPMLADVKESFRHD